MKDHCRYVGGEEHVERAYTFPHLAKCHATFMKSLGQVIKWPGYDPDLMQTIRPHHRKVAGRFLKGMLGGH
jgi:hypothetical protein